MNTWCRLLLVCLLAVKARGKFVMLPMDGDDDSGDSDDGNEDLSQLAKTGQIPDSLLKDILAEAGHYMTLYNYNPSSFLKKQKLVPHKRSQEQRLRKKMTNGIVGLTRPRFGKRSTNVEAEIPVDVDNSLARSLSEYMARNSWMINLKKRNMKKDFSNLTRPRFGKRSLHGPSHILKFLQNEQAGKNKRVPENEEPSDNTSEEEDVVRPVLENQTHLLKTTPSSSSMMNQTKLRTSGIFFFITIDKLNSSLKTTKRTMVRIA